eukprot:gene15361-6593_t
MGQYPSAWQTILGGDYRHYNLLALLNVQSLEKDFRWRSKHLNVGDGVILVEATRYAINRVNMLGFLRLPLSFQITDCRESRAPFSTYQDILVLNGLTSWQTTYYLITNTVATAPMANVLASSEAFDHVMKPEVSRKFKMDEIHRNVFRTVPSDALENEAIVDILERLNWTYISVVSSNDLRTQQTVENFAALAYQRGICISQTIWISDKPSRNEYVDAAIKLTRGDSAKIVVLVTMLHEAMGVLNAVKNNDGNLTFIAGTGFRANLHDLRVKKESVKGLLHLQHADTYDKGFEQYFMNLKFGTNKYRWFGEFWSMLFNCSIPYRYKSLSSSLSDKRPRCTGIEDLHEVDVDLKYSLVKPILNAVDSFGCALKESEAHANCSVTSRTCRETIMKNSVKFFGKRKCKLSDSIAVNEQGFNYKDFLILNFNGSMYKEIGKWTYDVTSRKSSLNLSREDVVWSNDVMPLSTCYKPCPNGFVKDRGSAGNICCFTCSKCGKNDIVSNDTCVTCPLYEVPNWSKTSCDKLPSIFVDSQYGYRLILIIGSTMGIVLNTVTIGTFVWFRDRKVIKATGVELSLFILVALYLCFVCPFVFVLRPSVIVCGIQRFIMSLSLNASYIPLLLKTSRIYRIFKASKSLVLKPSFVSTKSQLLICIFIICIQLLLGIVWVAGDRPKVRLEVSSKGNQLSVLCRSDPANAALNLLPCVVVMGACTFFGYKTRNFPSNFNEAFSISITMYISCFLWSMFIPLLFLFDLKRDNAFVTAFLTSYFMIILGLVMLAGIFGTRILKIYMSKDFTPEQGQMFLWNVGKTGKQTRSDVARLAKTETDFVELAPVFYKDNFNGKNVQCNINNNRKRCSSF